MKLSRRTVAAAGIAIIIAAAAAVILIPPSKGSPSTCAQCFQTEPIVDVVSPSLGNAGSSVNPNRIINMSAGSSRVLEIDVYPTIAVNVSLGFTTLLAYASNASSGSGALPSVSYNPETLQMGVNAKGVSYATIAVPAQAAKGTYDSVFTVTNVANSSETWGLYFQLVVQ